MPHRRMRIRHVWVKWRLASAVQRFSPLLAMIRSRKVERPCDRPKQVCSFKLRSRVPKRHITQLCSGSCFFCAFAVGRSQQNEPTITQRTCAIKEDTFALCGWKGFVAAIAHSQSSSHRLCRFARMQDKCVITGPTCKGSRVLRSRTTTSAFVLRGGWCRGSDG